MANDPTSPAYMLGLDAPEPSNSVGVPTACAHSIISTFEPLPGWSDKPTDEWDWTAMCFACKASGIAYHDRGFEPNAR